MLRFHDKGFLAVYKALQGPWMPGVCSDTFSYPSLVQMVTEIQLTQFERQAFRLSLSGELPSSTCCETIRHVAWRGSGGSVPFLES